MGKANRGNFAALGARNVRNIVARRDQDSVVPASGVTERVVTAILRAIVVLGLACGASPRSTEQRAMRAVCGYLCYTG
jgi:hypothetical protein